MKDGARSDRKQKRSECVRHGLRRRNFWPRRSSHPGGAAHGSLSATIAIGLVGGPVMMAAAMVGRSMFVAGVLRVNFAAAAMRRAGMREGKQRDHQECAEGAVASVGSARSEAHGGIIGRVIHPVKASEDAPVQSLSGARVTEVKLGLLRPHSPDRHTWRKGRRKR